MVVHPRPRPPVYTLPTPWPPHVPPQAEPEQAVVPRRPRKKKLSAPEEAQLVDSLVDGGMSLTKARQQIATQQGKLFPAIERVHQRHGRHKGSKKNQKKKDR